MEKSIKIMTIIGIVVQGLATVFSLLLMVLAASGVMTTDVSTTVNGEVDPVDAETAAAIFHCIILIPIHIWNHFNYFRCNRYV